MSSRVFYAMIAALVALALWSTWLNYNAPCEWFRGRGPYELPARCVDREGGPSL